MAEVERDGEGFVVAAELLADALRLAAADVPGLLAAGRISSRCEEGVGADAGRWRLTFSHGQRRLRLVVDGDGRILTRSVIDIAPPPGR